MSALMEFLRRLVRYFKKGEPRSNQRLLRPVEPLETEIEAIELQQREWKETEMANPEQQPEVEVSTQVEQQEPVVSEVAEPNEGQQPQVDVDVSTKVEAPEREPIEVETPVEQETVQEPEVETPQGPKPEPKIIEVPVVPTISEETLSNVFRAITPELDARYEARYARSEALDTFIRHSNERFTRVESHVKDLSDWRNEFWEKELPNMFRQNADAFNQQIAEVRGEIVRERENAERIEKEARERDSRIEQIAHEARQAVNRVSRTVFTRNIFRVPLGIALIGAMVAFLVGAILYFTNPIIFIDLGRWGYLWFPALVIFVVIFAFALAVVLLRASGQESQEEQVQETREFRSREPGRTIVRRRP